MFREYEIVNDNTIKINLEFVYPFQDDIKININSNKDRIVIKDSMRTVHLYKTEPISGQPSNRVKLAHIKVIETFPF